MFLFADTFGAFKEGVAANGLTVATWIPYILTALAIAYPLLQKFAPGLAAIVAALNKVQTPPVTPPVVNPPTVPVTGAAVGIPDIIGLIGGSHPIIDWFMSLPADKRAEFFVAVQKRFLP